MATQSTSSYSALRAAEEFVLSLGDDTADVVSRTRGRALELRSMGGEASLKLSERASDSADSVLAAATLLRDLNVCLQQVRTDIEASRQQLHVIQSDLSSKGGSTGEVTGKLKSKPLSAPKSGKITEQPVAKETTESSLSKKSREGSLKYFAGKALACERALACAATNSSDWLVCMGRASEEFYDILDATAKESIQLGWIGKFPEWSSRCTNSFVRKQFFALVLSGSWFVIGNSRGDELSEEQWARLGEGCKIVIASLQHFAYLFVRELEADLLKLIATLLGRAKDDAGSVPDPAKVVELTHPIARALRMILPVLQCHQLIREMVAPLVLVRCSMFLQGLDEKQRQDARLSLNNILMIAGVSLVD